MSLEKLIFVLTINTIQRGKNCDTHTYDYVWKGD